MPVLDIQETYKDYLSSIHEEIEDEEDPILRYNLLKKLSTIISKGKSEKDRLGPLQKFRQEMVDGNSD